MTDAIATEAVSIVTVTYGPTESLSAFLDSVFAATTGPADIVVVDNSDDGVPHPNVVTAADRPGVRLLSADTNLGYGRAANRGVVATSSEFVVIANPDLEWGPGALDELLAATRRWPRGGSFGPLIHTPAGEIYPSARDLPTLSRGIGHALLGWWWPSNPWTAAYLRERREPVERTAGWLSGSCLLVRRAAFDEVGGFDPAFFMYLEDVDLGWRLGRHHWQNVYVPSAAVTHYGGQSTAEVKPLMLRAHHRSAMLWLGRRYPGWRWAPVRLVLRVGLWARGRLALRFRRLADGPRPR